MEIRSAKPGWWMALVFCAAALSASAQGGASSSQTGLFASPGDGTEDSSVSSPFADSDNFADQIQAPTSLFNNRAAAPLPAPMPEVNQVLEERKNWALMTPEEILGLKTPEEILGVKKAEDIEQGSLTPEERFLLRQDTPATGATNGYSTDDKTSRWWLTKGPEDPDFLTPQQTEENSSLADFNRLISATPNKGPFAARNNSGNWIQAPVSTGDSEKADAEQQAEMERFRQMLDPGAAFEKPATAMTDNRFGFSDAGQDPYQKVRAANRAATSLSTVEDDVAKPVGLTPLPGLATEPPKKLDTTPTWAAKPPPWLSEQPNPFAIPPPKL